jgi:hypothetical protein
MMQEGYREVDDHKVKVVEAKICWIFGCVHFQICACQVYDEMAA